MTENRAKEKSPRVSSHQGRKRRISDIKSEGDVALKAALSQIAVYQAPGVRLIGDGRDNILFRRTASRPIRKLPLTPLQTYIWLHSARPIAINKLIDLICERIRGIAPIDIAWVITDLRRDGYLETLATEYEEQPS